ncbi:SRPBCC family protein [Cellulomonas carbonis]|uniref:ATPase n=1 Tax=Cellulomonas carbonis T26 TaxID=947969 RepID=A0A0A0BVP7_9CELL|nr:SRPBCC domain-containing protein [Cellulomonas carbonis]KGM12478.1 ATPase [Cellulomonas carbonis T26]
MSTTQARVERTLAAPVERVFRAWTDPDVLARWYCPNPDMPLTVEADVVEGGRYRVVMGPYVAEGTYTAVVPPGTDGPGAVVAFTWRWTSDPDAVEGHVRVGLDPADGGGTRLVLVHEGLADADDATGHAEGWELSLDRLEQLEPAASADA